MAAIAHGASAKCVSGRREALGSSVSASSSSGRAVHSTRLPACTVRAARSAVPVAVLDTEPTSSSTGLDAALASCAAAPEALMAPAMKSGYGAFGAVTLEKSKLELSSKQTRTSPHLEVGGGGGNSGNRIFNGGGGDNDDGGDDDDYFNDDDGDEGDDDGMIRSAIIAELFDRSTLEAVLNEWYRTIGDLPRGFLRAVEMGLISSAQLARFMSMNARPTVARSLSRLAPPDLSRAFVGRMLADPAFVHKFAAEQAITIASSVCWEVRQRGSKLRDEWDLALLNVLTLSACNAAMVWTLSPSRSYGTTAATDWQLALQKLPNHVFDKSYPLRPFGLASRAASLFYRAAQLSLAGAAAGAANGLMSNLLVKTLHKKRNPEFESSIPVAPVSRSARAYAAFVGLSGSLRYQLVYGADRALHTHLNSIPLAILGSSALRVASHFLGEPLRLSWLGIDSSSTPLLRGQAFRRSIQGSLARSEMVTVRVGPLAFQVPASLVSRGMAGREAGEVKESSEEMKGKKPKRRIRRTTATAAAV